MRPTQLHFDRMSILVNPAPSPLIHTRFAPAPSPLIQTRFAPAPSPLIQTRFAPAPSPLIQARFAWASARWCSTGPGRWSILVAGRQQ